MNSRVPEPVLAAEAHCGIQIESVLRIRPFLRKEKEDAVMLEPLPVTRKGPDTVVLNPMHSSLTSPVAGSSLRNRADSDSTSINVPVEYHFNHVLSETTNQDKLYYSLGHNIASDTMKSLKIAAATRSYRPKKTKSHLLVCMGVSNSGKTFTCFGGTTIPKRRSSQDGLVPRLMDSLFSQSKHNAGGGSKGFAIQISMVQVTQPTGGKGIDSNACQVHDLLAFAKSRHTPDVSPKRTTNMTVRNMAARFERVVPSPGRKTAKNSASEDLTVELSAENPKPIHESARDATQARETLQNGLNASDKLSKGNQNIHLLVTMQPVIDGTKYGDKIVVLDMAGLEKEKRGSGSRKNDNVSSLNQTASAAVLRCLRVMTHNVNAIHGRTNGTHLTCSEDEISEISFVSQAKDPVKRQLKPVPFRQHKVTMLLNPLFTKSSCVKVNILISAYPGHADLQQKRLLLQDVELLHGSSLVPPLSPVLDSVPSNSGLTLTPNTLQEENDSSVDSGFEKNKQGSRAQMARLEVTAKKPSEGPRAKKVSKHFAGVAAKAVRVEKIKSSTPMRQVQPTAPCAPSDLELPTEVQPREFLSDFPGVDIQASLEKQSFNRAATGGNPNHHMSLSPTLRSEECFVEKSSNMTKTTKVASVKLPLERSCLENSVPRKSDQGDRGNFGYCSGPSKRPNERFSNESQTQVSKPHVKQDDKINLLENKLNETLLEKQALERVCAQLEKENSELRKEAREAGRKVLQSQWTDQDEEEFMASRRMRREAQNLIKAPIQEHLEKVNYVYSIKNQWCMTNKKHFSLQLPDHFQRAHTLDMRDKALKDAKKEDSDNQEEDPAILQTRSEDLGCPPNATRRLSYDVPKPRTSLVSLPQKPVVERPTGMSALKRLTNRRKSNN
ncbi:MAG: hypothetical protein SGILL_001558 [Bacillariaceae sp.]